MNIPDSGEQDVSDMARLNAGHDAALNAIMERHGERLFHYLLRQLDNETDANEVAQEAFVRVYLNRARFQPSQKFSTWLYAIATNLVRDRFRWRQRHPQVSLEAESEDGNTVKDALPDGAASPSEETEAKERTQAVRGAVQALPEDLRTAVILYEYEGLAQAQIAAVMNCTVKAVETRLYRARAHLRQRLERLLQTM
jgi:RNA polymerase sigma-70 factor, ECF subfamily